MLAMHTGFQNLGKKQAGDLTAHDWSKDIDPEKAPLFVRQGSQPPTKNHCNQSRPQVSGGIQASLVRGPKREMTEVTVRPMKMGARLSSGRPRFQPSVSEKTIKTNRNVPRASTAAAKGRDTTAGLPGS